MYTLAVSMANTCSLHQGMVSGMRMVPSVRSNKDSLSLLRSIVEACRVGHCEPFCVRMFIFVHVHVLEAVLIRQNNA